MADQIIDWFGQSGNTYRYWFLASLEASAVQAVAGNYMFAKRLPNGNFLPIYIGETEDLRARLSNHERWADAIRAGATHAMGHTTPTGEAPRKAEERDLIAKWQPVLNTHHKEAR